MKTTLTPPPITPGPWTSRELQKGGMGISPASEWAPCFEIFNKDGKSVDSLYVGFSLDGASAQFIAAAPAMAEALENCRQYLASLPESMHAESSAVYLGALSALLQAGYVAPTADR